ncbi:hypothetical protein [Paludibacterium denitrificans]|uniref:hypothetical protein n=1 Tax=Paludibacterium denitrificans TaxID=2675226 RepID=UPI001E51013C|nr:hypothetical protein [Paludibacterium denitrificans]
MLTYSPHVDALPKPTEKPWLLLLLCFVWLWPGIIGHDPWKPDEPYVMAVVDGMVRSGNWLPLSHPRCALSGVAAAVLLGGGGAGQGVQPVVVALGA